MNRKSMKSLMLALMVTVLLAALPTMAQQVTGAPGSPSATTTHKRKTTAAARS